MIEHLESRPLPVAEIQRENSGLREQAQSLVEENSKLENHVRVLQQTLLKVSQTSSSEPGQPDTPSDADWMAASEMLVAVESDHSGVVFDILSGTLTSTAELVQRAGLDAAIQLVALLARSRTAVVIGDQILPTMFGKTVASAIYKALEESRHDAPEQRS